MKTPLKCIWSLHKHTQIYRGAKCCEGRVVWQGVALLLLLATGQQSVYVIIICMKICKSLVAKVALSATPECYSQFPIRIRTRFALLWVILLLLLFNVLKQLSPFPFPYFLLAFIPFCIELKAEIHVETRKEIIFFLSKYFGQLSCK